MSEPPPSTSAPDRHDLLAVRTIDSRIGALASALELPSAAMIRRDRGDSEGMTGLRAAEEQLAVRAGVGARAAVEGVHIWPAIEDVVPIASEDVVGALAAVESVDPARPLMWSTAKINRATSLHSTASDVGTGMMFGRF